MCLLTCISSIYTGYKVYFCNFYTKHAELSPCLNATDLCGGQSRTPRMGIIENFMGELQLTYRTSIPTYGRLPKNSLFKKKKS